MRVKRTNQTGFSAVELLITLFVAAAFIATGYQLYSIIVKNGGEVRMRAKASNIGYDNLRRYSLQAVNPCVATTTPTPTPAIPSDSGLPSPSSISVALSCPYPSDLSLTKIQVSVKYGSPQQEVVHAIYVTN